MVWIQWFGLVCEHIYHSNYWIPSNTNAFAQHPYHFTSNNLTVWGLREMIWCLCCQGKGGEDAETGYFTLFCILLSTCSLYFYHMMQLECKLCLRLLKSTKVSSPFPIRLTGGTILRRRPMIFPHLTHWKWIHILMLGLCYTHSSGCLPDLYSKILSLHE